MKSFCSCSRLLPFAVLALFVCSLPTSRGEPPSAKATAEPKTHVLFIGADVSVEKDKKLYHVDDVAGDNFIVKINKEPVRISADKETIGIKVDNRMQLTDRVATVDRLTGERVYSFGGDPVRRRSLESVEMMTEVQFARERANINLGSALAKQKAVEADPGSTPGDRLKAKIDEQRAEVTDANFAAIAASDFGNGREQMRQAMAEKDKQLFDAIEVNFTVSSPERLAEAYVVVIAKIRDPDSKPGAVRNWIYAKSIGEITDSPRDIHIKHGGFTPGFILEGFDLHLYSTGKEIATNVSPKRVEVTREDAAQYTLIEYLTSHKDATLPPTPALGRLPKDYHEHLGGATSPKVCFVRVTPDGVPSEIYTDPACTEKLSDDYIAKVLKQIWFKPALDKGKPIAGVARVKLASLTM